jgi:hypothetical protein
MAVTTSKVTYSLKPETVTRVEELAAAWNVPKSEVIRRAVEKFSLEEPVQKKETPLEVFLRLQKGGGISPKTAAQFAAEVLRERRASGRKRG